MDKGIVIAARLPEPLFLRFSEWSEQLKSSEKVRYLITYALDRLEGREEGVLREEKETSSGIKGFTCLSCGQQFGTAAEKIAHLSVCSAALKEQSRIDALK